MLNSFAGISNVVVDVDNNKVTITSDCTKLPKNCDLEITNSLDNTPIVVDLKIEYDIACVSC
jgi:hypothetical protein